MINWMIPNGISVDQNEMARFVRRNRLSDRAHQNYHRAVHLDVVSTSIQAFANHQNRMSLGARSNPLASQDDLQ